MFELDLLGVGWRALAEAGRPRMRLPLQRTLDDDDPEEVLEALEPMEDERPRGELDREDLDDLDDAFTLYDTDLIFLVVLLVMQSLRSLSIIIFLNKSSISETGISCTSSALTTQWPQEFTAQRTEKVRTFLSQSSSSLLDRPPRTLARYGWE